jgi:hypothetical protein
MCATQSRLEAKLQLQFVHEPTLALLCKNEIELGNLTFSPDDHGRSCAAELVLEKEIKVCRDGAFPLSND